MANQNTPTGFSRLVRMALALPLLFSLTAARLTVSAPPQLAVTDPSSTPPAQPVTAKVGDTLLTAKVYDLERVKLTAPMHITFDKFAEDYAAGTRLTPVMVPSRAKENTGLDASVYYCGSDLRSRSKFTEWMIGDWFSKWEPIVRFCFTDTDHDQKIDHMVLAGTKDKLLQKAVAIDPVPYTLDKIVPDDEASEVRLIFRKLEPATGELHMELQLYRKGERQLFTYLLSGNYREEEFLPPSELYPQFKFNPKKTPYPATLDNILGATVEVKSIDTANGTATFEFRRPIGPALFKPINAETQFIYVYI